MKRGATYVRRSKHNDDVSLENQEARCRAYASTLTRQLGEPVDIVHVYTDNGASGKDFDRPEYIKLRRAIDRGELDVLIVNDIARLGRTDDVTDMFIERRHCMENGVRAWAVKDNLEITGTDEASLYQFFFGIVHYGKERRDIRTRTWQGQKATLEYRPQVRAFGGRPPFGYRAEKGVLVADDARAPAVLQMFAMAAGGVTAEDIALAFNRQGIAAPGGGRWYTRTVQRLLANPTFAGDGVETNYTDLDSGEQKTAIFPAPALVEAGVFAAAQRQAAMRRRSHKATHGVFWLSGLLRCGVCGRYLVGNGYTGRRYYRCITRATPKRFDCPACGMPIIPTHLIEEPVWADMRSVLSDPAILAAALDGWPDEREVAERLAQIGREVAGLKRRQVRLAMDWAKESLAPEAIKSAGAILAGEIEQLEAEALGLELRRMAVQHRGAQAASLDGLPGEARADLAQQMIARIDVAQEGKRAVRATVFYYLLPDLVGESTGGHIRQVLSTGAVELVASTPSILVEL